MKIILAFDSFKGSLTARQAVEAARQGIAKVSPEAEVVCLPLADGGEGTTDALCQHTSAAWHVCRAHDPLLRPISARYAVSRDGTTAIMDMAEAAGLTLLKEHERNPLATSTFGLGEMMLDAIRRGCKRLLVGIGGSATNDGGMGMLAALGARFVDERGDSLPPVGGSLNQIAHIDWSGLADLGGTRIEVVCDVTNPLFGSNGAAHVYAPQKGASATDVERLDMGLRTLASHCEADPTLPGCGAAGGLGYGLTLVGATLRKGIDVVLDASGIDRHLGDASLVLTGEGKIDRQTLNGKLPLGVLQRATAHGVPVVALAGKVEDRRLLMQAGFRTVESINPDGLPVEEATKSEVAFGNLAETVMRIMA